MRKHRESLLIYILNLFEFIRLSILGTGVGQYYHLNLGPRGPGLVVQLSYINFVYFSGFQPIDSTVVQVHKVLSNWADRVGMDDWEVNEDGVAGGIEKFREANTSQHWTRYQVPLSWRRI